MFCSTCMMDMTELEARLGYKITRRQTIERLGVSTLLALGLWPGALKAEGKGNSGSFRFLVINDTHYMSPECGAWLEGVVRQMKSHEGVEFCLHAGDLSDRGQAEELASVRDIFKGLGVPTHFVIGNHDYLTQDDRKPYEEVIGRRVNSCFKHRGWQILALDTTEGLHYQGTLLHARNFAWLRYYLHKLDPSKPTVILTHFPLGAGVSYRPINADDLLERFKEFNLQAVFSGHFHAFTERVIGATTFTTNRCCSLKRGNHDNSKEKGYFLCEAKDGRITRTFVEFKGT